MVQFRLKDFITKCITSFVVFVSTVWGSLQVPPWTLGRKDSGGEGGGGVFTSTTTTWLLAGTSPWTTLLPDVSRVDVLREDTGVLSDVYRKRVGYSASSLVGSLKSLPVRGTVTWTEDRDRDEWSTGPPHWRRLFSWLSSGNVGGHLDTTNSIYKRFFTWLIGFRSMFTDN